MLLYPGDTIQLNLLVAVLRYSFCRAQLNLRSKYPPFMAFVNAFVCVCFYSEAVSGTLVGIFCVQQDMLCGKANFLVKAPWL